LGAAIAVSAPKLVLSATTIERPRISGALPVKGPLRELRTAVAALSWRRV